MAVEVQRADHERRRRSGNDGERARLASDAAARQRSADRVDDDRERRPIATAGAGPSRAIASTSGDERRPRAAGRGVSIAIASLTTASAASSDDERRRDASPRHGTSTTAADQRCREAARLGADERPCGAITLLIGSFGIDP